MVYGIKEKHKHADLSHFKFMITNSGMIAIPNNMVIKLNVLIHSLFCSPKQTFLIYSLFLIFTDNLVFGEIIWILRRSSIYIQLLGNLILFSNAMTANSLF